MKDVFLLLPLELEQLRCCCIRYKQKFPKLHKISTACILSWCSSDYDSGWLSKGWEHFIFIKDSIFNQYFEEQYIVDAAKMAVESQMVARSNVPIASYIPWLLIPKAGYCPKPPSNISATGICFSRRQDQPLWFLCDQPQNQPNRAHTVRTGKGNRKKSLSDAFALWIMNSSRRSTHYNWNRLIINYAQSMSKRTSSECLMCGNSDWTLSWHFVISTCQQGAQA